MNTALAAVGRSNPSQHVESLTPIVFIDGVPDSSLSVTSFSAELPIDSRNAMVSFIAPRRLDPIRLSGKSIAIAIPHALSDGESRWQVLLEGVFSKEQDDIAPRLDRDAILINDRLTTLLADTAEIAGPWPEEGLELGEVIQRLGSLLQAAVVFACDAVFLGARIVSNAPQTDTLGQLLSSAIESAGLVIRQDLRLEKDGVVRTLTINPARHGRRISLPWPDDAGRGGAVESIDVGRMKHPPRAWIAQGDRPIVEDTFFLQAGWDPGLEGAADAEYGRLTSTDFSRYGSVYRAWVLNEDGVFSAPPFNLGQVFDAGALFETPGGITSPLGFGVCLTRDASGRSISPVIESSTDSGAAWSVYPGQAQAMADRAGVVLSDDVLPTTILSAAKAGTLRLRITASLTAPDPIEHRRWAGNPFAGAAPNRVVRFGESYRWQRVEQTSIHAQAINAGTLNADVIDDRRAMRTALRRLIDESPGGEAQAEVDLVGAWTAARVGDRIRDVIGPGIRMDGGPARFAGRDARVRRLSIRFGINTQPPRTRLVLD